MLDSYDKDAIVEIYLNNTPESLKNKTLAESDFKKRYNLNLLILKRHNRAIDITKDTVIQDKDEIVVFGNKQTIKDLFTYKIDELYDEEEIVKSKENVINLIDNYGDDAMAEVEIHNLPEILKDKRLFESEIKTKYNLNILTLRRDEMPITVTKDSIVKENDTVVVYGNYENIKKVFLV
jgi:Trk K+ transport system NAD-binding subunit